MQFAFINDYVFNGNDEGTPLTEFMILKRIFFKPAGFRQIICCIWQWHIYAHSYVYVIRKFASHTGRLCCSFAAHTQLNQGDYLYVCHIAGARDEQNDQ